MTTSQTPAWRLVPVEPTEAMLHAASGHPMLMITPEAYAAMLAASPSPELPAERARLVEEAKQYALAIFGDGDVRSDLHGLNECIEALAALPAPPPASVQPVALGNGERAFIRRAIEYYANHHHAVDGEHLLAAFNSALAAPAPQAAAAEEPWRVLDGRATTAYSRYIDQMRRDECLGWEHKVKHGKFGEAELKAHCTAAEYLGMHRAYADASMLAHATLAATLMANGPAEPCIGRDPKCPCQDGDTCHYRGRDAFPIPAAASVAGLAGAVGDTALLDALSNPTVLRWLAFDKVSGRWHFDVPAGPCAINVTAREAIGKAIDSALAKAASTRAGEQS